MSTKQELAQLLADNPDMSDDELLALARQKPSMLKQVWAALTKPIIGKDSYTGWELPRLTEKTGDFEVPILPGGGPSVNPRKVLNTVAGLGEAMSSPLDVAGMLLSGGGSAAGRAGLMGVSKAARVAEAATSAPYAALGAYNVATATSPLEAAGGALQAGLGALGTTMPLRQAYGPKAIARNQMPVHQATGGSTFNKMKGNMAGTDAYAVGGVVQPQVVDEPAFNQDVLENFIRENTEVLKDTNKSVGTWADQGKVHMDVSDTVPKEDALRLAKDRNEQAVFGLKNMDTIQNPAFVARAAVPVTGMAGADAAAAAITDDPEQQKQIADIIRIGSGVGMVGMAARGFNPKVMKGLKQRTLNSIKANFPPEIAAQIAKAVNNYRSSGLLGDVISNVDAKGAAMLGPASNNAAYAALPKQERLVEMAQNAFGKPLNQLDEEETWRLLQMARKESTGFDAGMVVNSTQPNPKRKGTVEHELGHMGQDLAPGGLVRDEPVKNINYPVRPHEVASRVREKKVELREFEKEMPGIAELLGQHKTPFGKKGTREQWLAELERVNEATRTKYGHSAGTPEEMEKARQRLMGVPSKVEPTIQELAAPLTQRAVGAEVKVSKRALAKRAKAMKVKDWQVEPGPWVNEGIDLNERTLNKADIIGVKRTQDGRQVTTLKPKTAARFEKLLQYAEENGIGKDWANGNWMDSFATPQEALEFADHWAATSPRNQLSKNLTDAMHTFVSTKWGIPVEEIPNLLPAWRGNVKKAVAGKGAPVVTLSGPKVKEMQGGIRQDPDAVPIDVHFMRAAGYDPRGEMSGPFYDQFKTAFQEWARERGQDPFPTMAKIWSAMRLLTGRTKGVPSGVQGQLTAAGLTQPGLFSKNPLLRYGPNTGAAGPLQEQARAIDLEAVSQPNRLYLQRGILPKQPAMDVAGRFDWAGAAPDVPEGQLSLGKAFMPKGRRDELARIRQLLSEAGLLNEEGMLMH